MIFGKNESAAPAHSSAHVHYKDEIARLSEAVTRLQTKVEMLEAKEEAQKELRELTNQKFDKITSQIGEIRELFKVLSGEKKELEVKVEQTAGLVKQAHPEQVIKQLQTFTHQIAVIDGKIQLINKQYDAFKKEYDRFAHKLKVFKGEDELLKLQARVKSDLDDVTKVSHQAGLHAAKIENHFIKINEKAAALQADLAELKALRDSLSQLQIDLTKQSEAMQSEAVQKKVAELEETLGGLTELTTESFTKLKQEISARGEKASGVNPVEFEKMRRWVAYLIKLNQAKTGSVAGTPRQLI